MRLVNQRWYVYWACFMSRWHHKIVGVRYLLDPAWTGYSHWQKYALLALHPLSWVASMSSVRGTLTSSRLLGFMNRNTRHMTITVMGAMGICESVEMWEKILISNAPTICYWTTVRDYLLINCRFIRGQLVGDWHLPLSACSDMFPWLFAFGHTNYARWMPAFLKDMAQLSAIHPSVHEAFM